MKFRRILEDELAQAIEWIDHQQTKDKDSKNFIFPRAKAEYISFIEDEKFWCVEAADGAFVAVGYSHLDEVLEKWEIGGFIVDPALRRSGVAQALFAVILSHLIVTEDPISSGDEITVVVHRDNLEFEHALVSFGFEKTDATIKFDAASLPVSSNMARDSDGFVRGIQYRMTSPKALDSLLLLISSWNTGWRIQLSPTESLEQWREDISGLLSKY
ncbi:MAG: GNAT family N-acetyltransferase [Yoonia sp.]